MEANQSPPPSPDSGLGSSGSSEAALPEEVEFEVDYILARRRFAGTWQYLVVWVGFPHTDATWEPEEHLEHADLAVREFERRLAAQRYWQRQGEI